MPYTDMLDLLIYTFKTVLQYVSIIVLHDYNVAYAVPGTSEDWHVLSPAYDVMTALDVFRT